MRAQTRREGDASGLHVECEPEARQCTPNVARRSATALRPICTPMMAGGNAIYETHGGPRREGDAADLHVDDEPEAARLRAFRGGADAPADALGVACGTGGDAPLAMPP